ncbi:MAG: FAD-dependent thymidylate synthase [Patescibacteria group bacterium]
MNKAFSFHKDLHIASLTSKDSWHEINVHALLQHPEKKQPSINAFLGARYSRSADSVVDIAKEVHVKGQDAAQRLATIFQNYGHKSVGDMADLFLCIEHVPMITAMKLFYRNPVLAGQERSTRYQDFARPSFVTLPDTKNTKKLKEEYEAIIHKQLADYRHLMKITQPRLAEHFKIDMNKKGEVGALQARTFDTARYLLPMGLQTSLGFVMSARNWSELIAMLGGSQMEVDHVLSELIFELLTAAHPDMAKSKYIPEADGLIRHTEASTRQLETTTTMLGWLEEFLARSSQPRRLTRTPDASVEIKDRVSSVGALLRHLQLLQHPLSKQSRFEISPNLQRALGRIVFERHNHHFQLGPLAQSGTLAIEGMADLGTLKDLNRHRSLERFVPIWHDEVSMKAELDRPTKRQFFVCDYLRLPGMTALRKIYESRLIETYDLIRNWQARAEKQLSPAMATEFTKYLLPHAHSTAYRFYGSVDDLQYLIHLRTRPGGHIAYRALTATWLKKLAQKDQFWQPMHDNLPTVDAASREQFVDRS